MVNLCEASYMLDALQVTYILMSNVANGQVESRDCMKLVEWHAIATEKAAPSKVGSDQLMEVVTWSL